MILGRTKAARRLGRAVAAGGLVVGVVVGGAGLTAAGPNDTVIDVWYGDHQTFGHIGAPQRQVNVLGSISDPDGILRARYRLNGGAAQKLKLGPSDRRAWGPGDFVIELDYATLPAGLNTVTLEVTDVPGNVTTRNVTVEKVGGRVWPLPYTIDWSTASSINDVAQVVDGRWAIEGDSVRPMALGYDRLVDIGDMTWQDYDVTVPITVHSIDHVNGDPWPSNGPLVGVLLRWTGHYPTGTQPNYGYKPYGAFGAYHTNSDRLTMLDGGSGSGSLFDQSGFRLELETTYMWRFRVQTVPGVGGLYQLRVWEAGQPEPTSWNITRQATMADQQNGSFLLVAHHVDASFGDVTVAPIAPAAAMPTIIPSGGSFAGPTEVSLTTATPGATIRYTVDGTTPTATSPVYTGPFTVSVSSTVRAAAFKPGLEISPVASATFSIGAPTAAAPVINPAGGTFPGPVGVSMTTATPGASIHYTLDGTKPTGASPVYTAPFTLTSTATVKAIALAAGHLPSALSKAKIIIG